MSIRTLRKGGASKRTPYPVYQIDTLASYIEFVAKKCKRENIYFRGQRKDWSLVPKLDRIRTKSGVLRAENSMLASFRREGVAIADEMPDNDWELLALAQHNGMVTRLLDWSGSPLVALWFTVEKPPIDDEDGVVWFFQPLVSDIIDDVSEESPLEGSRTRVFIPKHVDPRIRAQEGLFTVHKFIDKKGFIPLESNVNYKKRLAKIIIPHSEFAEIRYQLDRCGINASSLFPDLYGLCKNLSWLNQKYEDE